MSREPTPRVARDTSLEPTFAEGHHIGATAGVSFLYHTLDRGEVAEGEVALPSAPLICHGDIVPAQICQDQPMPTREEAAAFLERYIRFATPTYRFLHRPTLEGWTSRLLSGSRLSTGEAACTLLVFSQALLYTEEGDRYIDGGDRDLDRSQYYFERAKSLLGQEPGPATVASVQSRLAMCLYLLSTFRINECRYCFSFACTILTAIGLHRNATNNANMDIVSLESRKRTFWCAYVLDDYMSVMLGRPRILRDEDIDQPYPRNIDDQDLLSSESVEDLPLHGNLEAFIAHAILARLIGRNSDVLYPLYSLTDDEVFARTNTMLQAVLEWRDSLPDFLKPRDKTLAGHRTFERQNTVLKLAYAHLRILVTRRCLLADFSRLGRSAPSVLDDRALMPIQECASAITTILNAIHDLIHRGALYQSFWFTQYVALVAISTLYVYVIQSSRANIPPSVFPDASAMLDKARLCQNHLAALAPEGSQARRHCHLLDRLRQRAEKDASRMGRVDAGVSSFRQTSMSTVVKNPAVSSSPSEQNSQVPRHGSQLDATPPVSRNEYATTSDSDGFGAAPLTVDDVVAGQFTSSEDDLMFQNLMGWGWETLDTIGLPVDGDIYKLPT
ncbi:hypothetical protein H2200_008844 [Cladophialophora chaetospira]|uniref:Xylanolytic transcriptional activator regulatory domain-containing protein n=1 Tax=Cladophialophora chaetospira TaxID=386627 RepID=A0AA39CFY8_9EURO|nr:hypothetical protein H2200_008844 [Cladophialophora chaetospira]